MIQSQPAQKLLDWHKRRWTTANPGCGYAVATRRYLTSCVRKQWTLEQAYANAPQPFRALFAQRFTPPRTTETYEQRLLAHAYLGRLLMEDYTIIMARPCLLAMMREHARLSRLLVETSPRLLDIGRGDTAKWGRPRKATS